MSRLLRQATAREHFADDWDSFRERAETARERAEIDAIFLAHTEAFPACQHHQMGERLALVDGSGPDVRLRGQDDHLSVEEQDQVVDVIIL